MNDVKKIHKESFLVDAHCDLYWALQGPSLGEFRTAKQIDFNQIRKIGINLLFAAASLSRKEREEDPYKNTLKQINFYKKIIKQEKNLKLIKSKKDLINLKKDQVGIILHIEGAEGIKNLLSFNKFYNLGVRSIGLTWNFSNHLAGGSYDFNKKIGISLFGKKIISEMNKKGMIVDGAHLNPQSLNELILINKGPFIISHANTYAICKNRRNLTSSEIKKIKEKKGVIGLFFSAKYVKDKNASLKNVFEHLKQIKKTAGVDVIGIGSDFGGITTGSVKGLEKTILLENLTKEMIKNNFGQEEIKKILGENFKKVILKILK